MNVLPQPGTGQMKWASFLLLEALAACVAEVVTCFFSTWRIGGRRVTPFAKWPWGSASGAEEEAIAWE